jgi:hypothetical protein
MIWLIYFLPYAKSPVTEAYRMEQITLMSDIRDYLKTLDEKNILAVRVG